MSSENEEFNIDDLPEFHVPDSFFNTLYEFTGTGGKTEGGYMIAYVTHDGKPVVKTRSGSQIIEMGLRKAMFTFLDTMDSADQMACDKDSD